MSKKMKTLGKALSKAEQQAIHGGQCPVPTTPAECAAAGGFWFGTVCLHRSDWCL